MLLGAGAVRRRRSPRPLRTAAAVAKPPTATDRGTTGALAHRNTERLTTETKHSSKTSEFYAYVAATVGVLLAGLLTKAGDGHDDRLGAHDTWLIVGILTVGYMISRGLAKSGSRDPYFADGTNDTRGDR